jgi:hypothetical protein
VLRVLRPANPAVRALLRSRAHRLLSGRLAVLAYEGHRSGRTFEIPLRYAAAAEGRFVAVAVRPERKLWWRSFAEPREAGLLVRCERVRAVGRLAAGEARQQAAAAYVARYPRSQGLVRDAAVVVFERAG